MPFVTDKQTLDDLNIPGKYRNSSVFNLFNQTQTAGGERLLEGMFQKPLTDITAINQRSNTFQYFQRKALSFPFDREALATAENYLSGGAAGNPLAAGAQAIRRRTLFLMGLKEEYQQVLHGLAAAISTLLSIQRFVSTLLQQEPDNPLASPLREAAQTLNSKKMQWLAAAANSQPSLLQTARYDYLLRAVLREEIEQVLHLVHLLDVYIAVSGIAATKNMAYAQALPADNNVLEITEGFHPCIEKAIPNSVQLDAATNMIFLTGANMAGKSTFMKSFGIAVYLAHMGFPVPARAMRFSIKEGIYTSINVPDNLDMGYSHFYAEVLRVKNIAQEVSAPKNLVVIFDELFKGTNVKDAYDATLSVSEAFGTHRNCFFIISTHIVEVGVALGEQSTNVRYTYMPTEMQGKVPVYTYRSQEGISSDRHGMMIIENEKILDMIP